MLVEMALVGIIGALAAAVLAMLLYALHKGGAGGKAHKRKRLLEHELERLSRQKVNKSLVVAFAAIMGLLTLPLLTASATGELTASGGRVGVLALLAFFTATYAIIMIHAVLGRD